MKHIIFILMVSVIGLLNNDATAGTGSSTGLIKTILWYEGHQGVLIVQDGMSDLGCCGRSDYYILDDQHPNFKEIYSLVLAAHMSNQPLALYIQDCSQGISRIKHVQSNK